MKKYFTAGLHFGAAEGVGIYRFYNHEMVKRNFLEQCRRILQPDDHLYIVGDAIEEMLMLELYDRLPECHLHFFCGERERQIENFEDRAIEFLGRHRDCLATYTGVHFVTIGQQVWRIAYDAAELGGYSTAMPSICGNAGGLWRTRQLTNLQPIVNVSYEAWCGQLVTEDFLQQEYDRVIKQSYPERVNGQYFYDAHYQAEQDTLKKINEARSTLMQTPEMKAHIARWGFSYLRAKVLVQNDEGKFLVVEEKRARINGVWQDVSDIWNFPSGSITNPTENIFAAARREVLEETGFDVELTGFIGVEQRSLDDDPCVTFQFVGKLCQSEPSASVDQEEIWRYAWLSEEQIHQLVVEKRMRSANQNWNMLCKLQDTTDLSRISFR